MNIMHYIAYAYSENRLTHINSTLAYGYDANGNMNTDHRKDVNVVYNLLNLPHTVSENSTVKATYKYVADGTKASAIGDNGVGFEYLGSLVYNNNNGPKTLESTSFGGGRINATSNDYEIDYFITDHLGSTRVIVDNAGNIKEQNDYYPFGMRHENSLLMVSTNRWEFGGKEKQTLDNMGWLDFMARMLTNCEIPMFTTQDPLQEKRPWLSSYVYCSNSPMNRVDPNGLLDTDYYNLEGKHVKHTDDGKTEKLLVLTNSSNETKVNAAIANREVVNVPSNEVVSTMEKTFELTENSGNEHYFRVGENGTVSSIVEGEPGKVSAEDIMTTAKDLTDAGDRVAYDVHTHTPPTTKDGVTRFGYAVASDTDLSNVSGNQSSVVLGYKITNIPPPANQIGGYATQSITKQIGFYNRQGVIGKPIDFSTYKNAVKKINK